MKKRMFTPDFFSDEELVANLDVTGRLFYLGTWSVAEDSGVFLLSPLSLKMKIFPGDDISIEDLQSYLDTLIKLGKIITFESGGKTYGWLRNFHRHQKLDNPPAPTLPLPVWMTFKESENRRDRGYEIDDETLLSVTENIYVQDMSGTNLGLVHVNRKERKRKERDHQPSPNGSEYSTDFEDFWRVYPNHVEKKAAFKAWNARIKDTSPSELIKAATAYASECQRNGTEKRFIKHPSTFLGPNKPYEDYLKVEQAIEKKVDTVQDDFLTRYSMD